MKIEFDLPEFEKEISVNIIIRKDGEVVVSNTITRANFIHPDVLGTAIQERLKIVCPKGIEGSNPSSRTT